MHKCCEKLAANEGVMSDRLNNEGYILVAPRLSQKREKARSESMSSAKPPEDSAGCPGEVRPECKI